MDRKPDDARDDEAQQQDAATVTAPGKVGGDLGQGSHEQSQGGKGAPSPPGYGDQ